MTSVRVIGGGFYGCHIALSLKEDGYDVELHEMRGELMHGASGGIPARLHQGFHYPRSRMTRAACLEHNGEFLERYGHLTRNVPVNIYAIADQESMVDYQQYIQTLRNEVSFIEIYDPLEYGLLNVEGAVLTGERHIITDWAKEYFEEQLSEIVTYNIEPGVMDDRKWDWTIDCTFCAKESSGVDRYEPCLVVLLDGPTDRAITIMDGPFGSIYPWNEEENLSSLSSAKWTPFSKKCKSWTDARQLLRGLRASEIQQQTRSMIDDMARFYPAIRDLYTVADARLSIRAMPKSGADTRLVDVVQTGNRLLRVRAGKIDAIIHAEREIKRRLKQ